MRITDSDGHYHIAEITTNHLLSGFGIPVLLLYHPLEEEPEVAPADQVKGWSVIEASGEELLALALGGYEKLLSARGSRSRPLVADYVRARRRELKLTQEGLAKRLGISRVSITRWEAGEHVPSAEHLEALEGL
ncbi:helix-turn-helix transcriptional regulator [Nitrospinae bacterium AH-259-F20]|nr:helix-turn-helix transcriptional regulator [Nitrospinae bacterium AH-259-F20]